MITVKNSKGEKEEFEEKFEILIEVNGNKYLVQAKEEEGVIIQKLSFRQKAICVEPVSNRVIIIS